MKHPLTGIKVKVEWANDEPDRPNYLYVAYVGEGLIRFTDSNNWDLAKFDAWVPLAEVVQMQRMARQ